MDYSYRNLILWQKAQTLALAVIQLTSSIPRGAAADVLARQVIRSASSIGANIAEGHGRYTPRAHANHLSIAKGSACETDSWLDLMQRARLITRQDERRLNAQCTELVALLTSKIRELERITPDKRVREDREQYSVRSSGSRFEVPGSALASDPEGCADDEVRSRKEGS